MKKIVALTLFSIALGGCLAAPNGGARISYPDTTLDADSLVQIIPDEISSFDVVIRFKEAVTGINANDFIVSGGFVGSIVSTTDKKIWTVTINVDTDSNPERVELEYIGSVSNSSGITWSPDITAIFAYQEYPFPAFSVSYPDTSMESGGTRQIIKAGDERFDIEVTFEAPVSGFNADDITLSGGTVTGVTSNQDATVWTVTVEVDLEQQPSDLSFEITGYLQTQSGLSWSPDLLSIFSYERNYSFDERYNDSSADWGVSRATSESKTAVIYATNYANDLANGKLSSALDVASTNLEFVGYHWDTGIPIYRGTVVIGDETYNAEMLELASGALSMRIFDPTDIIFASGDTYTGSLTGEHTFNGALLATLFNSGANPDIDLEGDFKLIANFTNETFSIESGANNQDEVQLFGNGVMDSAAGTFASDGRTAPSQGVWLVLGEFDSSVDLIDEVGGRPVSLFGNVHGDGSDITAIFFSEDDVADIGEGTFVGTILGSR